MGHKQRYWAEALELERDSKALRDENRKLSTENRRLRAALSAIQGVLDVNLDPREDARRRPAASPCPPGAAAHLTQ